MASVGLRTVSRPMSREQINKLGKRLASGTTVSDEDLRALEELIVCHLMALELARPRVNSLATDLEPLRSTLLTGLRPPRQSSRSFAVNRA